MSAPQRIQRKRTKGWRMPPGAKYVGRPTRWGNPVEIRRVDCSAGGGMCWSLYADDGNLIAEHIDRPDEAARQAVELYLQWLDDYHELRDAIRQELHGRDLACWCPLAYPCHADVLLEVANA